MILTSASEIEKYAYSSVNREVILHTLVENVFVKGTLEKSHSLDCEFIISNAKVSEDYVYPKDTEKEWIDRLRRSTFYEAPGTGRWYIYNVKDISFLQVDMPVELV